MKRIVLSSNPETLREASPAVTVEAEYGDVTIEGSVATFAHHGRNSGNPAPCVNPRVAEVAETLTEDAVIGVSHLDLDTLGALILLMGLFKDLAVGFLDATGRFFELASFVDVNGPHKLNREDRGLLERRQLHAWWAWSRANPIYAPRDGSLLDITDKVIEGAGVLKRILMADPELLKAGEELIAQEDTLNTASLLDWQDDVAMRKSDQFTNHLYAHPWDGSVAKAVVALNTKQGSVTVSLADPLYGVSCRKIVQDLWGPEAGGHDGIAGSPRDREMTEQDLIDAANATAEAIKRCRWDSVQT